MTRKLWVAVAACGAVLAGVEAAAHHSVSGQFDSNKPVTLEGVISKIDWINPHIYVYLDVPNEDGGVTTWRFASLPTAMLRKAGLTSEMVRGGGAVVTAHGIRARDGTENLAWLHRIDYPEGHHYQFSGE